MTREEFFAALAGGARWDVGVSINRTNPLPLDANSIFQTLTDAEKYAKTNVLAYPGQIITVVDTTTVTAYVIAATGASGTLNKLASTTASGDVTADIQSLQGEIANIKNGTTVVGAATKATQDGDGKVISEEYAKKATVDTMATKLGTIAEGAQVNVIEGVAAKTTAEGGFVDLEVVEKKVQLDLSAFATKADVSAIPKFAIEVVTDLPTENISESTIYLKAHEHGAGDSYDEYIYTAGKWEKIGNTDVDLSGYLKSADAATTYLTKTDAGTTYATKQDVTNVTTNLTDNYVTNTALEGKGYITAAALDPYATTESVTAAIGTAKTELQTEIDKKQTADQVKQIIADSIIAGSKVQGNVAQATLADSVAHTLTAGAKTFNGSADVEITAADLGALTAVPAATTEANGGVKLGYTSTATKRALQLDEVTGTAFVEIPAAMTYAAGDGLSLTDGTFAIKTAGVTNDMIKEVNVNKLVQTEGEYLILNGGNAALTYAAAAQSGETDVIGA